MITYRNYQAADWQAICQIHDRARPDKLLEIGDGSWTIELVGNKKAIALYESEGFQEVSRFADDNAGYPVTCVKMKRMK